MTGIGDDQGWLDHAERIPRENGGSKELFSVSAAEKDVLKWRH